jgi:hypothetical protein
VGDMDIIEKLIRRLYRAKGNWFHSENFEDYLDTVVLDTISYFVRYNKHSDFDEDNWFSDMAELERIYRGLIPYLKKKYYNEMKTYYRQMKS